jgi:hypothetical protein
MSMNKRLLIIAVVLTTANFALAQNTTSVGFDSGDAIVKNFNGIALTQGPAGDGNGAVLQLGYFTNGTSANPFAGTFVPLSGQGSANTGVVPGSSETYNQTSIGDEAVNSANFDGGFAINLVFQPGDPAIGNNLPPSTTIPLAIRFYDGTTIAGSTRYNTVSSTSLTWLWQTPNTPPSAIQISLNDSGIVWEDNSNPLKTSILIAIPEPSSLVLLAIGGCAIPLLRRRKA